MTGPAALWACDKTPYSKVGVEQSLSFHGWRQTRVLLSPAHFQGPEACHQSVLLQGTAFTTDCGGGEMTAPAGTLAGAEPAGQQMGLGSEPWPQEERRHLKVAWPRPLFSMVEASERHC